MKMEEQLIVNDEISFSCGNCRKNMGPMNLIIETGILSSHTCFRNTENVTLDYEKKLIFAVSSSFANTETNNAQTASCSETSSNLKSRPIGENVWSEEAVKLLINVYDNHKYKFDSPSYSKKKVWEIISTELNEHGYTVSGLKCDEKWRNLKKTYDKVLKEKNTTGNAAVSWKFFERFHNIYFKDPHFNPVATTSSSGITKRFRTHDNENKENISVKKKFSPGEKPKKKSLTPYEIELRRQKRHEEKMGLKREMFEWFKNNYKKD